MNLPRRVRRSSFKSILFPSLNQLVEQLLQSQPLMPGSCRYFRQRALCNHLTFMQYNKTVAIILYCGKNMRA